MAWEDRLRVGSNLGVEWQEGLHFLSTRVSERLCTNFLMPLRSAIAPVCPLMVFFPPATAR